jgi:uncharacterized protein YbcI
MTQILSKRVGFLSEAPTKPQGEIQAAICEVISSSEQDGIGRGPKDIRAHLIGDLLVVRLVVHLGGVLTPAEQQLVRSVPTEKANDEIRHFADLNVHRLAYEAGRP